MTNLASFAKTLALWNIKDFSIRILFGILYDSSKYYRSFQIPKRRGGTRKIDAPYPILGQIQKSLFLYLQDYCQISEYAYAYQSGRNAIMHASAHLGCNELLTIDIKDFFNSTKRQKIYQVLIKANLDNDFAHVASLISTLNGVLPQGAPTSPLLSNAVFSPIDARLARLATHLDLTYTRYADDLAFSGKKISRNLPKLVEKIISEQGYQLNPTKTVLKVQDKKKIITGVSISSGIPKPPRQFVRSLRANIHYIEKNFGQLSDLNNLDPLIYERILGKLNYWLQIEPNNIYAIQKKKTISAAHQHFLGLSSNFNLNNYIDSVS